jgi:butyrate kinase
MNEIRILAINPGSTSTKIAVYENTNAIFIKNITHTSEELAPFQKITEQFSFRKNIIIEQLKEADIPLESIHVIVGRGGLVKPIPSGVYEINEALLRDLNDSPMGEHASNLGGLIAEDIRKSIPGSRAFIADPVVVDELEDIARYSGHPLFRRVSIFHALNQKAIARIHAETIMRKYEEMNLIVAHMGGGISVGAHCKGKVIDVNNALDGEGPFSPERSGTLPVGALVKACFSGNYSQADMIKMIKGNGGLVAYLGTNSGYEVEQRMLGGDEEAKSVFSAMAYQVAKAIGEMAAVLRFQVDAILLTGGVAHSKWFVNEIIERVYKIATVHVYPGEDEMKALAMNGLRVATGKVIAIEYK